MENPSNQDFLLVRYDLIKDFRNIKLVQLFCQALDQSTSAQVSSGKNRPEAADLLGRGRARQHRPGGRGGGGRVLSRGRLQLASLCGGQVDPG